ncbi:MAG: hypothetical protein S4CHLAM102_07140 [Chlamydiia bacterium]|nr:hypothetical protein [Chlamydiia bacterium]
MLLTSTITLLAATPATPSHATLIDPSSPQKEEKKPTTVQIQKDNIQVKQAPTSKATQKAISTAAAAQRSSPTSEIMIVEPAAIAKDWMQAFSVLESQKVKSISFDLSSGEVLTNVTGMKGIGEGYLILFELTTPQGHQFKIVKTADITAVRG